MAMIGTGTGMLARPDKLAPLPPQAKTLKRISDGYASNKDRANFIPMPAEILNDHGVTTNEVMGMSPAQKLQRGVFYWMSLGDLAGHGGRVHFTGINEYMGYKPVMCMRNGVGQYIAAHSLFHAITSYNDPCDAMKEIKRAWDFKQNSTRCSGVNCDGHGKHIFCKMTDAELISTQYVKTGNTGVRISHRFVPD